MDIIEANSVLLEDFLKILFSKDVYRLFPNNHFPNDKMMDEFLSSISQRTDKEIKDILRKFLIHNISFGRDKILYDLMVNTLKNNNNIEEFLKHEYYHRALRKIQGIQQDVWEGLTWVLDLLPNFPLEAIKAIDAYFLANCQFLPDSYLNALSDCNIIIRARYINFTHPKEIFYNLPPKDFECLIAELYETMGYEVQLTKSSHDGGIDVVAAKTEIGQKEKLLIQ